MFGERDKQRNEKGAETRPEPLASKGATLVAANTRIEGNVHFSDRLEVQGQVSGDILAAPELDSRLEISAEGAVFGDIRVPTVLVNGRVRGNVHGQSIELAANARIQGDVHYQMIQMAMGARVDGNLVYSPDGDRSRVESAARPVAREAEPEAGVTAADDAAQQDIGKTAS